MDRTVRRLEELAEVEARFDAAPTVSGALELAEAHLALAAARALMGRRDLVAASTRGALAVLRDANATWPRSAAIALELSDLLFRCGAEERPRFSAPQRLRLLRENVALATRTASTGIVPHDEAVDRLVAARFIFDHVADHVPPSLDVGPAT